MMIGGGRSMGPGAGMSMGPGLQPKMGPGGGMGGPISPNLGPGAGMTLSPPRGGRADNPSANAVNYV